MKRQTFKQGLLRIRGALPSDSIILSCYSDLYSSPEAGASVWYKKNEACLCAGRTRLSSVHKAVFWLITKALSSYALQSH